MPTATTAIVMVRTAVKKVIRLDNLWVHFPSETNFCLVDTRSVGIVFYINKCVIYCSTAWGCLCKRFVSFTFVHFQNFQANNFNVYS